MRIVIVFGIGMKNKVLKRVVVSIITGWQEDEARLIDEEVILPSGNREVIGRGMMGKENCLTRKLLSISCTKLKKIFAINGDSGKKVKKMNPL